MRKTLALAVAAAMALAAISTLFTAQGEVTSWTERAEQILEVTGVKGGLIVHVGCGDGKLTAALCAGDSYLVHGLEADPANVEKARDHIRSQGLYGQVSVERWSREHLPYTDNLVNLLVLENPVSTQEQMRVLAPKGVAYLKQGNAWVKTVKPWPDEIDEWTHYLHDPTGNPVAQDTVVGPPRRYQWIGSPRWSRHHDHMSSVSAVVSSGGRLFTIFDEAPRASIEVPSQWSLIARDAFNGTILWKRPIARWHSRFWPLKSGPAQLPRRLVALDDVVYVTLGIDAPVTALDAATGRTIRIYQGTRMTEEIIVSDGVLFLLADRDGTKLGGWDTSKPSVQEIKAQARRMPWDEHARSIMAVAAETGEVLWQQSRKILPLTLTLDEQRVFFHDGEKIVCLSRQNGSELWHSAPVARRSFLRSFFAPTLVVYRDVVLFSGGSIKPADNDTGGGRNTMAALSAETGKVLWTANHPPSGYKSPEDILVVDGLVWSGATVSRGESGIFTGRDPQTGEIKRQFPPDVETYWFHHRCYRGRATENYLLMSRTGIEFVDFRQSHWIPHHWVRGACLYGIMPCNGLVYAPQHPCACYFESKLFGFSALAPESKHYTVPEDVPDEQRIERGPGYTQILNTKSQNPARDDWPTYRHDAARSGFTDVSVPTDLKRAWQTELGGRISSPVIAGNKVFVTQVDAHTVCALDASSGEHLWSYTAGGRVDSPPTVYQDRLLFGSADGHVYCLRTDDGQLIWRFRAAPDDRRMVAFEQVESVWPVHGSVLVEDDVAYCVAGRSMFLDGGLRLLRLDPITGRKLSETILDDRNPETGANLQDTVDWLNMATALPDILSSDGRYVYMRSLPLSMEGVRKRIVYKDLTQEKGDGAHLFCPSGFLDDAYWHRSYWVYGRGFVSGWRGYYLAGQRMPAGRLLVFDDSSVYGFGRRPQHYRWTTAIEYRLFATTKEPDIVPLTPRRPGLSQQRKGRRPVATRFVYHWSEDLPLLVRAMVLAGQTLFVAGPPDLVDEQDAAARIAAPTIQAKLAEYSAALQGKRGALLLAVSTSDGKKLAEYRLDYPPTWDGMAAAQGQLFLTTVDGKVLCFAQR